jgi:hypothetical protein
LVHERSYGEINKRFYEEEVRWFFIIML